MAFQRDKRRRKPRSAAPKRRRKAAPRSKVKRTARRRASNVETKKRVSDNTFVVKSSVLTVLCPNSFEFAQKGFEDDEMIGGSILSKWLTAKMLINYATCTQDAASMGWTLHHGWVKEPFQGTFVQDTSTPPDPALDYVTTPQGVLTTHMTGILDRCFKDPLNTIYNGQVNILGSRKIQPAPRVVSVMAAGAVQQSTQRPDLIVDLKWTTMKKQNYLQIANPTSAETLAGQTKFTILKSWIPFICFVPNTGQATSAEPSLRIRSVHYYTDG